MAKSNGRCGVGVAYKSRIGGEFLLDSPRNKFYYSLIKLGHSYLI